MSDASSAHGRLLMQLNTTLGPKPPSSAKQDIKRAYSEKVSRVVAVAVAAELRKRGLEGARPTEAGLDEKSGAERRMAGGIGAKKVDVTWSTEESGLLIAFSIKSINFKDNKTKTTGSRFRSSRPTRSAARTSTRSRPSWSARASTAAARLLRRLRLLPRRRTGVRGVPQAHRADHQAVDRAGDSGRGARAEDRFLMRASNAFLRTSIAAETMPFFCMSAITSSQMYWVRALSAKSCPAEVREFRMYSGPELPECVTSEPVASPESTNK
jgi:hypothetical protein